MQNMRPGVLRLVTAKRGIDTTLDFSLRYYYMSENVEDLRIDATRIISDNFGEDTATLFREYAIGKQAKEILFFLKELLSEYLGEEKSASLVDGLFVKYKLLRE